MGTEKISKGMIANKLQYSSKFDKKCSGKMLKKCFTSKVEDIKEELLAYSGDINTYRSQIPSNITPTVEKSYYGKFSEQLKSDKSLPKSRFSYSYEYKNEENGLTDEQAKAVEGYNNTIYKMYSLAEDMYTLKAAHKMLDNKRMYDIDLKEAIYFGIVDVND